MEPRASHRRAFSGRRGAGAGRSWIYATVLGVALAALATLQYRWTGEVSRLERERLGRATAAAMQRFAAELDLEVAAAAIAFLGASPADLGGAWQRYADDARHPELIAEVLIEDPSSRALQRYDAASDTLLPAARPPQLDPGAAGGHSQRPGLSVSARPPAVWLRLPPLPHRRFPSGSSPAEPEAHVLLRLDLSTLRSTVLPAIAEAAFGAPDLEQDLWLIDGDDGGVLWSSRPGSAAEAPPGAPRLALGGLGDLPELHERARHLGHPAPLAAWRRPDRAQPERGAGAGAPARFARRGRVPDAPPWVLVAQHPAGSLDRAVARLRARNLAVSFAVLALLGASSALLLLATRRAVDTARRQGEWVAGLTHELHTPLAALSAAGENLADGVIQNPDKVREYGELIRREGRRLQTLVAQALALARLDGPQRAAAPGPVELAPLVARAVADRELERRQRGATVAIDVPPELPPVIADAEALERVVGNLLDNALKHGGRRVWLVAEHGGREAGSSPRISVTVADDGAGLTESERGVVFEPYVRGARARASATPGAGLGLHLVRRLVEEMGGTVALLPAAAPGVPVEATGAAFRVTLPVAAPAEEPTP